VGLEHLGDELVVVRGKRGDAVVGAHEHDDSRRGDEQRVVDCLAEQPEVEYTVSDEVGRLRRDEEVLHHILQRPFVDEHRHLR